MMNKWLLRLIGVLILGVLGILFYDVWFRPSVPDTLQDEISLQVGEQRPTRREDEYTNLADDEVEMPDVPNIELTSLEDQNEPAVLSNPQPQAEQGQEPQQSLNQMTQEVPANTQTAVTQGGAWVQVGSFADDENAQKMVAQMRKRQWATDTEVANVNGKSYHRVFVGPLAASDVPDYLQQLQAMGINAREVSR